MPTALKKHLDQFKRDLLADRKKSALLGGLFLVLLFLVVKQFAMGSSSPELVSAAAVVVPQRGPVAPQEAAPLAQAESRVVAAVAPQKSVRGERIRPAEASPEPLPLNELPRTLARDPFRTTDWSSFGHRGAPVSPGGPRDRAGDGFWGRLGAKVMYLEAERREQAKQVDRQVESLALQSTVTGLGKLAYISGRLVREGDFIHGFSVLRIEERRVLLDRDGIRRVLTMP